jgi:3-oxoacyl-[acyl-carrier-protein] synthase II
MALALTDAGLARTDVTQVSAHGTSTVLNDLAEAEALTALFGPHLVPVTAVKGATGHMIAGSGAAEVVVALESARTGIVPPAAGVTVVDPAVGIDVVISTPRTVASGPVLSNAFGFGGTNAVLVIAP